MRETIEPVRHRYECPLRWADLDVLGHVNNVRYVDYLQEARGALLRACLQAAGVERHEGDGYVVARHEVNFAVPLMFGLRPVSIDSWVSEIRSASFTLDHEIYHDAEDGSRVVYCRARTVLAPFVHQTGLPRRLTEAERGALGPYADVVGERCRPIKVDVNRDRAVHHPTVVRFSDLDIYRHVNNVTYYEYFQEARIAMVARVRPALKAFPRIDVVLVQSDTEYVAPITLRAEPYDAWTLATRMGTKSMVIESELADGTAGGGGVLARNRSVLVFFDSSTQRSTMPPEGYRETLAQELGLTL